ncbi:MAG: tripartite tricarboxylate transporter TctB family protein [Thermodesulfobacteriota bacterium]
MNSSENQDRSKKNEGLTWIRNPDVIFQIIVLIASVFLLVITRSYPAKARIFPQILLSIIAILCCAYLSFKVFSPRLFQFFVTPESPGGEEEAEATRQSSTSRFYRGWLAIGITVGIFALFGFVFAIPVYFISYFFLLGRKKNFLKIAGIALATTAAVYIIFGYFLGVPISRGFLFGWKP